MEKTRIKSVLIVDDSRGMRDSLSLILKRKGFDVQSAGTGAEAVGKAIRRPSDIIFMDIKMAPMNGVQAFKRILQRQPDAHVIMMTAYAVDDLVEEAKKLGAKGVLYKPLDIKDVVDAVENVDARPHRKKILVVDDEPGIQAVLSQGLTRKGYHVETADDGEQALSMVQNTHYHMVFIDMKMPKINGLETMRRMRMIAGNIRPILMTGFYDEMEDDVKQALNEGSLFCLEKPFHMEDVASVIKKMERQPAG